MDDQTSCEIPDPHHLQPSCWVPDSGGRQGPNDKEVNDGKDDEGADYFIFFMVTTPTSASMIAAKAVSKKKYMGMFRPVSKY